MAILSLILSACTKKVKKFREAAFCNLEQIIKAFNNPDFFNVVFPSLFEMCNSNSDTKSDDIRPLETDAKPEPGEAENVSAPMDKVVSCITASIHISKVSDILKQQEKLLNMLQLSLSSRFPWNVKVTVFSVIKELSSKIGDVMTEYNDPSLRVSTTQLFLELFNTILPEVVQCIHTINIGQVHVAASECLVDAINMYKATGSVKPSKASRLKTELLHLYEVEKNEQAKFALGKCVDILNSLETE